MILTLIRSNLNLYLLALKFYAFFKHSKITRIQDKLIVQRDKNRIILAIANIRFCREIIDFFYFYFDSVRAIDSTVDFSKPNLHKIAFEQELEIWFPTTSEPTDTILQYRDILKISGGEVILDLGAYSCLSSILFLFFGAGQVISVEADPKNLDCCEMNLKLYKTFIDGRIDLYKFALSSEDGWAKFLSEGTMASHLVKQKGASTEKDFLIETRTLSTLAKFYNLDHIDIIKADIEGAEFDVFTDENFFSSYKPRILLEPINGAEEEKIIKLLKTHGYGKFTNFEQTGSRQSLLLCEVN